MVLAHFPDMLFKWASNSCTTVLAILKLKLFYFILHRCAAIGHYVKAKISVCLSVHLSVCLSVCLSVTMRCSAKTVRDSALVTMGS